MTNGMVGTRLARTVLLIDGVGGLAASLAVAASPELVRMVDASTRSRPWIAGALVVTGTLMTADGLRSAGPRALRTAAVMNALWATGCAFAAPHESGWGLRLVSATALLDAGMGVFQWRLAN
jgi:hypothetical protein